MEKNRSAKSLAVAGAAILLFAVPVPARAHGPSGGALRTPMPSCLGLQSNGESGFEEYFAGLKLTGEQEAEIAQIHQSAKARKSAVAKDGKLTADQKNAMLEAYTRLEYGQVFKVLTPEQRREVHLKTLAHRTGALAAQKKSAP